MGAGGSCFVCLGDKQEPFKLQGLDLQRIAERPTEDNEFEELSPLDWRPAQVQEWLDTCCGIEKGSAFVGLSGVDLCRMNLSELERVPKLSREDKDLLWCKLVMVRTGLPESPEFFDAAPENIVTDAPEHAVPVACSEEEENFADDSAKPLVPGDNSRPALERKAKAASML